MRPLYVRVHETDNVAIIVNPEGLPSGTLFESGLELRESVPQSHKVALRDIDSGEAVLRYGQVIGLAARAIPRGSWVREELVKLPVAPELDALPLCTAIPPPLPPLEGMTFEGFRNADGTAGTRNILGITTTVQCVAPTVEHAVTRVKREMRWFDDYLGRGMADRSANPTPGNKRGGLANVLEKALGSVAKSGSSPLVAVSGPGERVTAKGLVFAATPASDFICGTLQLAAGMNMHVFTTGEGSPYGLAMAPVLKVSSRTSLAERWRDLIDVDAGRIATGAASIETVGREIFELILDVASGRKRAWAERHGLANPLALFMPGPVT